MPPVPSRVGIGVGVGVLAAAVAVAVGATGCRITVKGQRMPSHRLAPRAESFVAAPDVAVLHYYGAGGWGIAWRGQYLLLAPYFSNHTIPELLKQDTALQPNPDAVRSGVANTPIAQTRAILIGHGHVDHAGDIGTLFRIGALPPGRAALIADRSTANLLGAYWQRGYFSCVKPLDMSDQGVPVTGCDVGPFRVTPLHSAHAPHLEALGVSFEMFGGRARQPMTDEPSRPSDFHLGYPWAFVIDLLAQDGTAAFRIHYMDAAAGPPHGLLSGTALPGRDVDVHIACVPGFNFVTEYPDEVLRWGNVRYVIAAHWEDFFRPTSAPLAPVPALLDNRKLDQFVDKIEYFLGTSPRGVAPVPGVGCVPPDCGPRGATWAMPAPGETFQFHTGPQPAAPPVADPPSSAR